MDKRTERIRALNDAFRKSFAGGQVMLTASVDALPSDVKAMAIRKVATFDAFDRDNDPHGEHDFGAFDLAGHKVFWKIDAYDRNLEFGSDDPGRPRQDHPRSHHHAGGRLLMLDNRKRTYALGAYTVEKRTRGWYFRKTDSDHQWRGAYSSEMSVCLMLARQLKRELVKRDGPPT